MKEFDVSIHIPVTITVSAENADDARKQVEEALLQRTKAIRFLVKRGAESALDSEVITVSDAKKVEEVSYD